MDDTRRRSRSQRNSCCASCCMRVRWWSALLHTELVYWLYVLSPAITLLVALLTMVCCTSLVHNSDSVYVLMNMLGILYVQLACVYTAQTHTHTAPHSRSCACDHSTVHTTSSLPTPCWTLRTALRS